MVIHVGHNHVNHLPEGKALGLQTLARGKGNFGGMKSRGYKRDSTMWEVVCKPVLTYGAEVWLVPVKLMNRDWNAEFKIERRGDEFWACPGAFMEYSVLLAVRGELGWRKLKCDRHSLALQYGKMQGD